MTGWQKYLFYIVAFGYIFIDFVLLRPRRTAKQEKISRDRGTSIFIYIVIGLSFFLTFHLHGRGFLLPVFGRTARAAWALGGLILALAALGLRYASKKALGEFFTVKLTIFAGHRLVTAGIYRSIRHPAYLGLLLWLCSLPLILAYPFGLVTLALPNLLFFMTRIIIEERALREKFGEEYRRYMNSTSRLLPYIW